MTTNEPERYQCSECGHVCTEAQMGANYLYIGPEDGEIWSNWVCPKCHFWHTSPEDAESGWKLIKIN